jgi:hypothetical protein
MNSYPLYERWLYLIGQFDNANAMIFMIALVVCIWVIIFRHASPDRFKWVRVSLDYAFAAATLIGVVLFAAGAR